MSQSNLHNFYATERSQTFLRWLHDNCESSGFPGDKSFLPHTVLFNHLDSNNGEVLNALLGAFYEGQAVPISAKGVLSAYSRIFCILMLIGKLEFLPTFMSYDDLNDKHLPFNRRPSQFPHDPASLEFFERFYDEQWRFCPPLIDANCSRIFEEHYVLPFTKRRQIAEGASATISTIEIHPEYVDLPSLKYATNKSTPIYALKTYRGWNSERSWSKEVEAFRKLHNGIEGGSSPNIIGFYTAFKHGSTYHCILEYADRGSLEEYLQKNAPPTDGIDIARLWKRVLGITRGLKDLHNGTEVIWHQDLKPANVLVLSDPRITSPYASIFKICDLGTSHSKRIVNADQDHSNPDAHGTRTYGSPECYRSDSTLGEGSLRVTPAVDVFSLGCILSEFAVWMSGGYEFLQRYREDRRVALKRIPDFHDGDCFHDSLNMLPVVGEWHRKVETKVNFSDDVFTPALIPMIEDMLKDVQSREDAKTVCRRAHDLFARALQDFCRRSPDRDIPDDIQPRAQRGQSQRTDPPVLPFDADQQPIGKQLVILSASPLVSANNTTSSGVTDPVARSPTDSSGPVHRDSRPTFQSTSISGSQTAPQGVHAFESGSWLGTNDHVSAPIEAPNTIFEDLSPDIRRHSEQYFPEGRLRTPREGLQISSIIDSAPQSAFERQSSPPFHNSGLGVNMNDSANHSHEIEPYSLLSQSPGGVPSADRPSTCCPVVFPPISASMRSVANSSSHRPVAKMSRSEAILWRDQRKTSSFLWWSSSKGGPNSDLRDKWVLDFLQDRDSVIIIDDSESMRNDHWDDMTELLSIITYMIKSFDEDGLDLYFANSNIKYKVDTSKKIVGIVEKRKRDKDFGLTDMTFRLERILDEYARKLQLERWKNNPPRGLNVYIFTDARWTHFCDIVPAIDKMVETLVALKLPEKQVGLQFISFGDDEEGLKRLKLVDNYLVLKPKLPFDIVDTTPSTGDLYKMIRGAVDRNFDYASEEISNYATSSPHLPP